MKDLVQLYAQAYGLSQFLSAVVDGMLAASDRGRNVLLWNVMIEQLARLRNDVAKIEMFTSGELAQARQDHGPIDVSARRLGL